MKIDPNFAFDLFKFLHKPIRDADKEVDNFLERYFKGPQEIWEDQVRMIFGLFDLLDPEACPAEYLHYMKDIVGLTRDLRSITDPLSENDLRKIILLAVPLWKSKGPEAGYKNIIKLFTGFNARIFNWFDYRFIVGEKAIGEEQLGEDAWIISRPGVAASSPESDALLILQFEKFNEIKDGSVYENPITPYGDYFHQSGGAFASSDYHLQGTNFYLKIPHRAVFDLSGDVSFDIFFKTTASQLIPLFEKYDSGLNKGVKIHADTNTDNIHVTIGDSSTVQNEVFASGIPLASGSFVHVACVVDWSVGTTGELSVWVDGTRIGNVALSGAFLRGGINNEKDSYIFSSGISGRHGALDAVRLTKDVRYNVSLANITVPGVNFIEYQAEQLDEFQMDIRVVDDGTLDRANFKRIVNLMRMTSERLNILYIDFFDDFIDGKGQYQTIAGTAYTEQNPDGSYYLKMPPNSLEHANIIGSADWSDYVVQHRASIYNGTVFEYRFLIQDDLNFYAFRIDAGNKLAHFEKSVAGVRTALDTPKPIDVEPANLPLYIPYYLYLLTCKKSQSTGLMNLRAFIDSNLIFNITDSTFDKGTFGLYTPTGTTLWCSDSEMFIQPLEFDRINPNDSL